MTNQTPNEIAKPFDHQFQLHIVPVGFISRTFCKRYWTEWDNATVQVNMITFEQFCANANNLRGADGSNGGESAEDIGLTCIFCDNMQQLSRIRHVVFYYKPANQTVVIFVRDNGACYDNRRYANFPYLTIRYADDQFNCVARLIRCWMQCHNDSDGAVDWSIIKAVLETTAEGRIIDVSGAVAESVELDFRQKLMEWPISATASAVFVHFELPDKGSATQFMKSMMRQASAICSDHAVIVQSYDAQNDSQIEVAALLVTL